MKLKKSLSLLLLASILITTLFAYPVFANLTITLSETTISVPEGGTFQLSVTTNATKGIDWYCGGGYADVNGSGLVTGLKAGTDTIIVTAFDGTIEYTAECTVYVYKPDGVYYIKNLNSNYYLHVEMGGITDETNVYQCNRTTSSGYELDAIDAKQLWKTHYLGEGKYSIRPYHKINMGLRVDATDSYDVDITDIGTRDTISALDYSEIWTIQWYGTGYMILQNGSRSRTLQIANASTSIYANVIVAAYANNNNCKWAFEKVENPPEGFYFYDTEYGNMDNFPSRYVAPRETLALSSSNSLDLELSVIQLSDSFDTEPVNWTSSNPEIATVVSNTGMVTGVKSGTTTITATLAHSGYSRSYTLHVTEIPNGTYYLKNIETGCFADMTTSSPNSGTAVYQYRFFEVDGIDDNGDGEADRTGVIPNDINKWTIKRYSGVYYTITAADLNASYYLSVKNGSTAVDVGIVVYTGTVDEYMKWRIEPVYATHKAGTPDDTSDDIEYQMGFKIMPKHTAYKDYVLATATSSALNEIQLLQGDYMDNDSYRDVWNVIEEFDMAIYGIDDTEYNGHDHSVSIEDIRALGAWGTFTERIDSTGTQCRRDLANHDYFIIRTHGNDDYYHATAVQLEKNGDAYLFSHEVSGMSEDSDYIHDSDDFGDLKLALWVGCETGYGGTVGFNLPVRTVARGARTSIGFNVEILCGQASSWTEKFWKCYLAGNSVELSAEVASTASGVQYSAVVICGDEDMTIYN